MASQASAQTSHRFGLWVEAEGENQPFRSRNEYEYFLAFTSDPHFTDLYCQIYREGRSWFPSMMADDGPYRQALSFGLDPLKETIKVAHQRGQRVHAWVNVLRVSQDKEAPLLQTLGTEALQVDSFGNTVMSYGDSSSGSLANRRGFQLETPGVWLDPSSEKVRRYLLEIVRDIVTTYPDIDGIHLDMMRYPAAVGGLLRPEFGYSKQSINAFYTYAGKPLPRLDQELNSILRKNPAWAAWRRAQVTLLVFEINNLLKQLAPKVEFSAAVIASSNRAYGELFQDWGLWIKEGALDAAIPMNYTKDNGVFDRQTKWALRLARKDQLLMGIGAWLMKGHPASLTAQGELAFKNGAGGVVLFSYSNLASKEGENTLKSFFNSLDNSANKN